MMASSVMGRRQVSHQHHANFTQKEQQQNRNYNNNMMTQSRQNGSVSTSTLNGHGPVVTRDSNLSMYNRQKSYDLESDIGSSSHYDDYETYFGMSHYNQNQDTGSRREQRERRERDFVPSFLLLDACNTNDERKVREICKKLSTLRDDDVQPVANFQDQAGRTPLSYAAGGGSILVIEELSRIRIIDPNLGDNDGNTCLHYASQAGHSEAVDLLIARFGTHLDLNCRNTTGLTPLMKAATQGRSRCAKSLLSAGALGNLRDYSRGLTAAEWARLCGRHICSEVIARGAKDAHRQSGSTSMNFPPPMKPLPGSRSNMELKRVNSDESPYYHLYARSTVSGANWLKNKIKKALGGSGGQNSSSLRSPDKRPPISDGSYKLMGGATICAGSLLLPSIKPLIEQQRAKQSGANKKFTIPSVQVTPVKR